MPSNKDLTIQFCGNIHFVNKKIVMFTKEKFKQMMIYQTFGNGLEFRKMWTPYGMTIS